MFLCFLINLSSVLEHGQMIYADDTTIINAQKRTELLIKNDIVSSSKCIESNKRTIKTENYEAMIPAAANKINGAYCGNNSVTNFHLGIWEST